MQTKIEVEICVEANTAVFQNVTAAYQGGARRIELCADMVQDGLTPDVAQIEAARAAFGERNGLLVMIRPRGGGFAYSQAEVDLMLAQMEMARSVGADGVVFGALQGDGFHLEHMRRLTDRAHQLGLRVTCHRAFDAVADREEGLRQLIDWGVARVLTNGTKWDSGLSVLDGAAQLANLMVQAQNRIEIVVGGGVGLGNVQTVLAGLPSGVGKVSVHVYSAVLREGMVDETAVRQLVQTVQKAC